MVGSTHKAANLEASEDLDGLRNQRGSIEWSHTGPEKTNSASACFHPRARCEQLRDFLPLRRKTPWLQSHTGNQPTLSTTLSNEL